MPSPLKNFFLQFSHFFTGNAFSLILGFITFPILTRILSQEQYGILGLVSTTMLITVAISKAGLSNGIIRFHKDYSESQEKRRIFASTVLFRGIVMSIALSFIYLIAINPTLKYLIKIDTIFFSCFYIMTIYVFVRPLNIIVMNLLRVNGKTLSLNLIGILGRITSIGSALVLLIYILGELYGYFIGLVIGELTLSIVFFSWFFVNYTISPRKISHSLTIKLFKFGTPLLFTEISYLLLSYADRYMIVGYHGEKTLGLYSVGYNLAMYIGDLISFPLSYAVIPIYVKIWTEGGKEETENFLQKSMHYLLIAIIPICVGYYAISEDLFVILASEKYKEASYFSPLILLGTISLGLNNILNAGLYLEKKSFTIFGIMLSAVFVNIVLNIILLPNYGVWGAAFATLIACIISSILTIYFSFKYLVIRVDIKHILFYSCIAGFMLLMINLMQMEVSILSLVIKICIGIFTFTPFFLYREKKISEKITRYFHNLILK